MEILPSSIEPLRFSMKFNWLFLPQKVIGGHQRLSCRRRRRPRPPARARRQPNRWGNLVSGKQVKGLLHCNRRWLPAVQLSRA